MPDAASARRSVPPTSDLQTVAAARAASASWPDVVLDDEAVRLVELIMMAVAPAAVAGLSLAGHSSSGGEPSTEDERDGDGRGGGAVEVPLVVDATIGGGQSVALRTAEGDLLAGLDVTAVQATVDGRQALRGRLRPVQLPTHYDHVTRRRTPAALRSVLGDDRGSTAALVTDRPLDTAQVGAAGDHLHVLVLDRRSAAGRLPTATLVRAAEAAGASTVTVVPAPAVEPAGGWPAVIAAGYGVDLLDDPPAGPARIADADLRAAFAALEVPDVFSPAVAAVVREAVPAPEDVGFTVLFTGFSGSGKSTVAGALVAMLRERGGRRVTVLDGDLVRTHLSSELGFSRAHRDLNVTRIGFVAAEVTRHGGIAVCAPIAPYAETRRAVREMVEANGVFVLVHVATPLEVCEARDRKGLYAKARSGLIAEFTGISDPYDVPTDADLVLDTTTGTPGGAAAEVMAHLVGRGLLAEGSAGAEPPR